VAFAVGVYQGRLRRAIGAYKYHGQRRLAPMFAGILASFVEAHAAWFEEFDLITAVPSYRGAGARRSWDPVGEILAALAARLGPAWPVEPGLVVKTTETPGMTGLGWGDRQAVARGPLRRALAPGRGPDLAGAQVLVLDDVLTEGGTLGEVARVLRTLGASDVAGLVLARPGWDRSPPVRPARPPGGPRVQGQ
jgi:predicted amidophosphoribosyltransferase